MLLGLGTEMLVKEDLHFARLELTQRHVVLQAPEQEPLAELAGRRADQVAKPLEVVGHEFSLFEEASQLELEFEVELTLRVDHGARVPQKEEDRYLGKLDVEPLQDEGPVDRLDETPPRQPGRIELIDPRMPNLPAEDSPGGRMASGSVGVGPEVGPGTSRKDLGGGNLVDVERLEELPDPAIVGKDLRDPRRAAPGAAGQENRLGGPRIQIKDQPSRAEG